MFEPLYTAAEMRRAEEGHDVAVLMDRAGKALADDLIANFEHGRRITVVCGGGSNGGDGRVAARYLEAAGREVRIVDARAGDADLGSADVIVDALSGRASQASPGRTLPG